MVRDFEDLGEEICGLVSALLLVVVVVVLGEADDDGVSTGTYNLLPLRSILDQYPCKQTKKDQDLHA